MTQNKTSKHDPLYKALSHPLRPIAPTLLSILKMKNKPVKNEALFRFFSSHSTELPCWISNEDTQIDDIMKILQK
jgi:hypothetical protein